MFCLKFYICLLVTIPIIGIQSKLYTTSKNNTYYIVETKQYTWYDAHIECSTRDMALLTIDSKEKYYDIRELLVTELFIDKPPHLWVGAIGINRKFAWILTGKPIIPSLWCGDCPNNADNNENCVQIWGREHGLNDVRCNWKIGFVCEDRVRTDEQQDKKSNYIFNFIQNK